MTTKQKVGIVVAISVVSFAFGRYSVPNKTFEASSSTTNISAKKDESKDQEKKKKKTTKIVKITKPDGTVEQRKTVVEEDKEKSKSQSNSSKDIAKTEDKIKEVVNNKGATNISALFGYNFLNFNLQQPTFGAQLTQDIIGPINIGAFGFANGLTGISLGLRF